MEVVADAGLTQRGAALQAGISEMDQEVAHLLGGPPAVGGVRVYLVSGLERMREVAQAQVAEWAAGLCIASRGVIVLRADVAEHPPFRSLRTVLRHEWVHLLLGQWSGSGARALPLWFEEGVAERVGGGVSVDGDARLDLAAMGERLIPFSDLDQRFPVPAEAAALAYAQSRSFVDYVIRQEGWDSLRQVLARVRSGGDPETGPPSADALDRALLEVTGVRLGPWEAYWREELVEQAKPWFHLVFKDLGWTLMIVAALIACGTFFTVRRRRRAQIQALPDG